MVRFSDSVYALSSFHVAETDILLEEQASELDELSETFTFPIQQKLGGEKEPL
jgi:hypothetical protein